MFTITPNEISKKKLYGYLVGAVAPRPIAFASTVDENGTPNLAPYSFFNVFSANPPILVFSPARSLKDNSTKDTLNNCIATKEVVINIVNFPIVQQMSLASSAYPKDVNEFEKAGLTMLESEVVKPFRVAESPIQFECKVNEVIALGDEGGAGNLVVCEVLKMHIDEAVMDEGKYINQHKMDLVSRAGGNYYSRARDGFFEIQKPLTTLGIGFDQLPQVVRESTILTGNDLGMLANVEKLPSRDEVATFVAETTAACPHMEKASLEDLHKKAKSFLEKGDVTMAWKLLLSQEK